MSFRDFNEDGPGTVEWDIVMGQNTTGMFSDETHYVLEGDQLTEVTFSHTGGGALEPSIYGLTYTVENIGPVNTPLIGQPWFTFEQDGCRFKATLNKRYKQSKDCYVVDIEEVTG
jgi:hypothetical protein